MANAPTDEPVSAPVEGTPTRKSRGWSWGSFAAGAATVIVLDWLFGGRA